MACADRGDRPAPPERPGRPRSLVMSNRATSKPAAGSSRPSAPDRASAVRATATAAGEPFRAGSVLPQALGVALDQLAQGVAHRLLARVAGRQAVAADGEAARRTAAAAGGSRCGPARRAARPARRWRGRAPSIHSSVRSGSKRGARAHAAAGRDRSAGRPSSRRRWPSRRGSSIRSACQLSTASISAAARAASLVRPLPWLVATERELGRTAANTGTPMRSSPVRSASRVMPIAAMCGRTRATVSAGGTARSGSTSAALARPWPSPFARPPARSYDHTSTNGPNDRMIDSEPIRRRKLSHEAGISADVAGAR